MYVKYKPTGQLGDIPDDKFDPSLFEVVQESVPQSPFQNTNSIVKINNAPEMQVPNVNQPQGKGFLKTAADFLAPKLSNVATQVINIPGMAKDYFEYSTAKTPQEKQKQLIEYNQKRGKVVEAQKEFGFDATKEGNQFDPVKYAKGTTQGALEAGSFAIPAGKTYKAAAGLGLVSGAMRGASEIENIGDISKVAMGALGGAAGGVVMKGIAGGFKNLGKMINNMAFDEGKKTAETMIKKGVKSLGEEAFERGEMGTTGNMFKKAYASLQTTEDKLQSLLKGSDKQIDLNDVYKTAEDQINKYLDSGNITAAESLFKRLDNISKQNGFKIPASKANEIKRSLYLEADNAFGTEKATAIEGIKQIARGFKKSIEKIDPDNIGKLNKELAYQGRIKDAMLTKLGKNARGKFFDALNVLTMAGGLGAAPFTGGISLTVPITTLLASSPLAQTFSAQTLKKIGDVVGSQILTKTAQSTGSSLGSKIPSFSGLKVNPSNKPNTQNYSGEPTNGMHTNSNNLQQPSSLAQDPSQINLSQQGTGSQGLGATPPPLNEYGATLQELRQLQGMAVMQGANKEATQLEKLIQIEENALKDSTDKKKLDKAPKLSEADKKFAFAGVEAQKALDALDTLQDIPIGPISGSGVSQKYRQLTGQQSKNETNFLSKVAIARTAARNALLGANMSDKEIQSLLEFTFDASLPREVMRERIDSFVDSMNTYIETIAGPETYLPSNPQNVQFEQLGLGVTP